MTTPPNPTPAEDPHHLARFVAAQDGIYDQAQAELRQGAKRSHWMWFVFPQLAGLGSSAMAQRYAIRSAAEAKAYLAHPLLGSRLTECTAAVLAQTGRSAEAIFGPVDAMKLKSSMTLFEAVSPPGSGFAEALGRYFDGARDERTLDILAALPD